MSLGDCCPVCTEELDPTDYLLASRLCQCRFSVCLWCFRRITEDAAKDSRPALCPNCREPYDIERITREGRELNPQQLEDVKRKKGKQEERKKTAAAARPRKDLANVRVVQRNLVYVVGLPMEICYEETLSSTDYIGQFGKIVKISVSRSGPYGSMAAKNGPTGSAYITFRRIEDARRCIESIHGTTWDGKLVKACYGTTKYCNAFLKGLPCNNAECLYLHDVAAEEDSYTKEETKSTKFVNLVHAASLNQASAVANGQPHTATSADLGAAVAGMEAAQSPAETEPQPSPDDETGNGLSWPSLPSNAWGQKPASTSSLVQAVPPAEDAQAWPGLPGGRGNNAAGNTSSAEGSETESEAVLGKPPLAKTVSMADKIARASSGPAPNKAAESTRKKLTPLSSRVKQATSADGSAEANGLDSKRIGSQELTRPSPPRTPQPDRKLPAPEASAIGPEAREDEEGEPAQQQTAGSPSSAAAASEAKTGALQNQLEASAVGPSMAPPGFTAPPASKPKLVTPPPGFAQVTQESGSRFASPYQSFGSDTSSPAPTARLLAEHAAGPSQGSSLQSIWGSASSLEAGSSLQRPLHSIPPGYDLQPTPQPRARSRFQFANDDDTPAPNGPTHTAHQPCMFEQPHTPEPSYSLGSGSLGQLGLSGEKYGSGSYPMSAGVISAVYHGYPGSQDWTQPNGSQTGYDSTVGGRNALQQATKGEGEESLPAGLLLLRKLQAQGGVSRGRSADGSSQQQQDGIFQDPAILSARSSSDHGDSGRIWLDKFGTGSLPEGTSQQTAASGVSDGQNPPRTPPRRGRKGKVNGGS